nr:hypothetical protein [Tanacetum cinerariifolium]
MVNYTMHVHDQRIEKNILDVNFFMERGMSPSTSRFFWSFNDSKLFSRAFNDSKLFSRTFNAFKLFSKTFKKCRVCKLQALEWKATGTRGNVRNVYASQEAHIDSAALLHEGDGVINKLCEEMAVVNEETGYFIQELDVVPGWVVATQKTFEFLKETQEKDDERLRHLKALAKEMETRAHEKCIFIKN